MLYNTRSASTVLPVLRRYRWSWLCWLQGLCLGMEECWLYCGIIRVQSRLNIRIPNAVDFRAVVNGCVQQKKQLCNNCTIFFIWLVCTFRSSEELKVKPITLKDFTTVTKLLSLLMQPVNRSVRVAWYFLHSAFFAFSFFQRPDIFISF